ncbi:hypothetical protein A2U01_0046935 [Trifolium medium]|uniref:Uncharacterized protein n=1 Tax=Trifolium medium TaxID=97028 RepID=A0A392QPF7_9FABA|nr:hypothetical protein [Trifolium medium]
MAREPSLSSNRSTKGGVVPTDTLMPKSVQGAEIQFKRRVRMRIEYLALLDNGSAQRNTRPRHEEQVGKGVCRLGRGGHVILGRPRYT